VAKTKVFCIGFQKTGTTSMEKALRDFGYRVTGVYSPKISLQELRETYVKSCLEIAASFDAAQDMPWPLMYRELDQAFPGSRFILNVRDTESWYKSISGHFAGDGTPLQLLIYGEDAPSPIGHEERYKQVYEAHNRAVKEYFKDRPGDLLVMDLEAGDGWEKLCPFLGEPIPATPFHHANPSKIRQTLLYRVGRRLRKLGIGGSVGTGFWAR
jgi:hypothetical protein